MESLKSQLGLRSMDMEGRSLGTERPSVSTSTGTDQARSASRFTSILKARTSQGAPGSQQLRQSTIDDVSSRIRDGRTDAAEVESDVRDAVRERDPVEDAAEPEREERFEERREPREERERREPRQRGEQQGGGEGRRGDGEDLSSAERSTHLTDASDARGHGGGGADEGAGDGSDVVGSVQAPVQPLPQVQPQGAVARAITGVASAQGVLPAAQAARGGATTQAAPAAPVGRATETRAAAKPQTAAAPRPGAQQMERAEAILDQLKVQIRAGDKEARLQLRPQELGLLDLKVKVDGGVVTANLAAESAETLAVLEAHAPELRAWLTKEGVERVELTFERMDVGAQTGGERGAAGDAGSGQDRRSSGRARSLSLGVPAASGALASALAQTNPQGPGVDLVA